MAARPVHWPLASPGGRASGMSELVARLGEMTVRRMR